MIIELAPSAAAAVEEAPLIGGGGGGCGGGCGGDSSFSRYLDSLGIDINDARIAEFEYIDVVLETVASVLDDSVREAESAAHHNPRLLSSGSLGLGFPIQDDVVGGFDTDRDLYPAADGATQRRESESCRATMPENIARVIEDPRDYRRLDSGVDTVGFDYCPMIGTIGSALSDADAMRRRGRLECCATMPENAALSEREEEVDTAAANESELESGREGESEAIGLESDAEDLDLELGAAGNARGVGFNMECYSSLESAPLVPDEADESEQEEEGGAWYDDWDDALDEPVGASVEEMTSLVESLQRDAPDDFNMLVQDVIGFFDDLGYRLDSTQERELNDDSSPSRRVELVILYMNRLANLAFSLRIGDRLTRSSSPAASGWAVGMLPSVLLTIEDFGDDGMVCVVCCDEMSLGDWATLLPCSHYYHDECIMPWLWIRNTCPLCRHELPIKEDLE